MKNLPKDGLKWVAAAFALAATATAEYEIARAIGMNEWIAAAVPGALDAYVVRALRTHREVLTAVLAMVGVNAASHLVTAGILPVEWPLITAVSAIAPLVLWRVHALGTPGEWRERKLWDLSTDEHAAVLASTEPDPEHGRSPDNPEPPGTREHPEGCVYGHAECAGERACTVYRSVHTASTAPKDREHMCLVCMSTLPSEPAFVEHMAEHGVHDTSTDQARVRAQTDAWGDDWLDVADAVHTTSTPPVPVHAPYVDHVLLPDLPSTRPMPARHLEIVPEHTTSTARTAEDWNLEHVSTGVLEPDDTEHMERARELFHTIGGVPTFRALKEGTPGMGTPRAQRIRAALKIENEGTD